MQDLLRFLEDRQYTNKKALLRAVIRYIDVFEKDGNPRFYFSKFV